MYDFNKKWESSFNIMHNGKFLAFMYFDWKALGMFSPIVLVDFGKHYSYGFPLSWSCELALVY